MKSILFTLLCLSLSNLAFAGPTKGKSQTQFGAKITTAKVSTLGEVMGNYDKYDGQTVVFEAKAKKVCEKKGCWMVLQKGDKSVRTLFKDYGFFVPKDIVGKTVRVQGKMKRKKVSAATLRHFKKDEGAKLEEIKKIKTGRIEFEFEADAVEII